MIAPTVTAALEILLVEDNPGDALLARSSLQAAWRGSLAVSEADALTVALELAREQAFDCVLLDLSLPDAAGLDVLAKIQSAAPDAAVVVLSGLADEDVALVAVQRGAQDYIVKGSLDDESFVRAVRYAIERKRAEIALAHQALHDPLTDLPNRALFSDRVGQALTRSQGCAVFAVDLDRFKDIDDELGRESADAVLREVAQRLCTAVAPADTVARFGGDEFMLLCEGVADEAGAAAVAERIAAVLGEPLSTDRHAVTTSASIGIALSGAHGEHADDLVREADQALYRAKDAGRNRYELADTAQHASALERLAAYSELEHAIASGELRLHYQPIVELSGGSIVGVEALVRWEHPTRGLVAPGDFIPLAEETGLIVPMGAWVMDEACRQAATWPDWLTVSINLSARQLAHAQLIPTVRDVLARTGTDPASICLEVTETVAVEDAEENRGAVSGLRALGVKLALDDFGTGYASLSFLKRFPLDVLKIDRSFVSGLCAESADAAIVGAVLSLARARGLVAVAEGVETAEEQDTLIGMGCARAQGYRFSRPVPADAFSALLG